MQYVIFIGSYARVGLALPLTFCLQSDEVLIMRKRRMKIILIIEILFILVLTINTLVQLANAEKIAANIFFDISIFVMKAILAIAMGLALRRLR